MALKEIDWSDIRDTKGSYTRMEIAEKVAEDLNLKIVKPAANELFVDIDSAEQDAEFWKAFNHLKSVMEVDKIEFTLSKSAFKDNQPNDDEDWAYTGLTPTTGPTFPSLKRNRHYYITLNEPISNDRRIMLQMLLCSDPKREALSALRLLRDEKWPTLFFEKHRSKRMEAKQP